MLVGSKSFKIGNTSIGRDHAPFVIAEISGNHRQELSLALELIDSVIKAGADAIKLQTYTAETMTLNLKKNEFLVSGNKLWDGANLYDLYAKASTPWEWHKEIFEFCKARNVPCFSSPFDSTAVELLESLNAPAYKIASFECIDIPLIKRVAKTGKPVIISTGMASLSEINDAVTAFKEAGGKDYALLKCTSSYPASPKNSHLLTRPHMTELFKCQVGLSDHTLGMGTAIASIALGATIIEKHVTMARDNGAVDSEFSLEPHEFGMMVKEIKTAWESLGSIHYGTTDDDRNNLKYRRSIYIAEDVKKGEVLNQKNLRCVRPGLGLPPKHYETLIGKKVNRDLEKGTAMSWDFLG